MKRVFCLALGLMLLSIAGGMADGMEEFEFEDKIPDEYLRRVENGGTVEKIAYPSKDYTGDGAEITKHAYVYLPPEYSPDQRYDLLVLCHGIGGHEGEWGFGNNFCIARNAVDHLITEGRTVPQKKRLIENITQEIHETTGVDKERIIILINDLPGTNVGVGGVPRG